MIRTTREITECACKNCGIVQLLGQTFNGQRCCDRSYPNKIGTRIVVEYKKTDKEEREDFLKTNAY